MKALFTLLPAFAALTLLVAQDADPTQPSPQMKAAMMARGSSIPALAVKGIVVGAGKKGVVLLEAAGSLTVVARPDMPFNLAVNGMPFRLMVKQITEQGVEIENPDAKETVLLPAYGSMDAGAATSLSANIAYLELRDATLMDALRMIADQSGNNYSASSAANKTLVNAFLRQIPAGSAVEEICKSHNLWFKRDEVSGITRIMSVTEFEKDLVGFREEQTEVFTLLYPNVVDVAISIADLFGDRVDLSLGNDDTDGDVRDLESRFDRFNIISQGNLTASAYQNSSTAYAGVNGATGIGGGFGSTGLSGGIGGGMMSGTSNRGTGMESNSVITRYQQRRAQRAQTGDQNQDVSARFQNLTPEQAQRVEQALASPAAAAGASDAVQALRKRPASIFVTASKRNNMVVVRTADSKALDDIRALVRKLDVPTPLVLLEVKVLSIQLGDGFQSAFEYHLTDGKVGGTFSTGSINPSISYDPLTGASTGITAFPGDGSSGLRDGQFIFQYLGDSFRARLQMLETKNRINTIASPTLLTAHNEVSRLFLGEERPVVRNISSQTILTDNNAATTPNTQVEFRAVGTTLLITPNINSDRTVTLRLLQESSSINQNGASIPVVTTSSNGSSATGVQNVPVDVVSSRSVSGTFVARDGMEVVVGGLIEDENKNERAQVPVIGRIPVLGALFRRQDKNKARREMIMMIRPHVMSTPSDGQRISENLLETLSSSARERLVREGFLRASRPLPAAEASPAPVSARAAAGRKK